MVSAVMTAPPLRRSGIVSKAGVDPFRLLMHLPHSVFPRLFQSGHRQAVLPVSLQNAVVVGIGGQHGYVTQYEDDFIQRAAERSLRERDKALAQKKAVLAQSEKRIAELDVCARKSPCAYSGMTSKRTG